ncbi:lipid-binding SYLF domain-containing protein [Pirellulimonas nuda]|nr:lipid-binding SYLF domain-containing protein [Pirellulimonas nuda]
MSKPTILTHARLLLPLLACAAWAPALAHAQGQEEQTVRASMEVLNEIMAIPAQSIPQSMLDGAVAVAIVPRVIKGGFIIGARMGHGTLMVRDERGAWNAPLFITLTGGSIGWQAGVQSTDVVLVFRSRRSLQGVLTSTLTLGVDAAAAAGPVGRQASAGTDAHLNAEVYSYARSRGLFLGVSFDGSVLKVDSMANAAFYPRPAPGQPGVVPPSAVELVQLLSRYSGPTVVPEPTVAPAAQQQPVAQSPQVPAILAQQYATSESDVLRDQLSQTAPRLFGQLDPAWRGYLALPAEVFSGRTHPSVDAVKASLQHYDQVRQNPQYQALAALPAFQSTYGLLTHYLSTLGQIEAPVNLPPPPAMAAP